MTLAVAFSTDARDIAWRPMYIRSPGMRVIAWLWFEVRWYW